MTFVDKYQLGGKQSSSSLLAVSETGSYVKNIEIREQALCIQKRLKNVGQNLCCPKPASRTVLTHAQQNIPLGGFCPTDPELHGGAESVGKYTNQSPMSCKRGLDFMLKCTKEHKGLQRAWSLCSNQFCPPYSFFLHPSTV